jgi:hypothetical protein
METLVPRAHRDAPVAIVGIFHPTEPPVLNSDLDAEVVHHSASLSSMERYT